MAEPLPPRKGRGALSNPEGRFESLRVEAFDDGWSHEDAGELAPLQTTVTAEHAKSILTRNDSPDVGFDVSINPYRGCEHGCIYCLDGDTEVLRADGSRGPIRDLAIGDAIVGTAGEEAAPARGATVNRRTVASRVLARWRTRKAAHRVQLSGGTVLIASADHRFLTSAGWKYVYENAAGLGPCLAPGDVLMRAGNGLRVSAREGLEVRPSAELKLVAIEPLPGERELFDITTSSGDFIANGVVSHNCFARPTHSYVNLSPGLDFETKLFYKQGAAELLEGELRKRSYVCKPINIGASTDPYQPIERKLKVTRQVLEVLQRFRNPVTIVTKSALVERDIDILADMARDDLVTVFVSITTLDATLKRSLEPRAPSPLARLHAVRALRDAGVPVGVLIAPIIPAVNDAELERIVAASAQAGAKTVGYVLLRLPYEVKDLFREWLHSHLPLRAAHVMSLINAMRGGRDNDPRFGTRMKGEGPFADLIRTRFRAACQRHGLSRAREVALSTAHFRVPPPDTGQLSLL